MGAGISQERAREMMRMKLKFAFGEMKEGAQVNIECDLIGKWVRKLLGKESAKSSLTMEDLAEHGFI